jgi:hypothetical protein
MESGTVRQALEAYKQRYALLGGLDIALMRDMAKAFEYQKHLEQKRILQADRDAMVRAFAMKEMEDILALMPSPPPFVDHTLFNRNQDKLNAAVKAEVTRQLQERDDDSGRTDD